MRYDVIIGFNKKINYIKMFWKFELDYIFTSKVIGDLILLRFYCDFIRILIWGFV